MTGLILRVAAWVIICLTHEWPCRGQAAPNDSLASDNRFKPGIFTNGFLDIMSNGQMNVSARFIRLYIGEPGKFAIPISVYSGVSANSFQDQLNPAGEQMNEQLAFSFINPLSGLVNVSGEGIIYLSGKKQISRVGLPYHLGERLLTGYREGDVTDPETGKPVNFLNSFVTTGLFFQTGAWERNMAGNMGSFWMVIGLHACYSDPDLLRSFLSAGAKDGFFTGYSLGVGVIINNLLNFRAVYYSYTRPPGIAFNKPIYKFSFNYSMR